MPLHSNQDEVLPLDKPKPGTTTDKKRSSKTAKKCGSIIKVIIALTLLVVTIALGVYRWNKDKLSKEDSIFDDWQCDKMIMNAMQVASTHRKNVTFFESSDPKHCDYYLWQTILNDDSVNKSKSNHYPKELTISNCIEQLKCTPARWIMKYRSNPKPDDYEPKKYGETTGETLLTIAAEKSSLQTVKYLVEDLKLPYSEIPKYFENGEMYKVGVLGDKGRNVFLKAAMSGNVENMRYFDSLDSGLKDGLDKNGWPALRVAIIEAGVKSKNAVQFMIEELSMDHRAMESAFHAFQFACLYGTLDTVKYLNKFYPKYECTEDSEMSGEGGPVRMWTRSNTLTHKLN
jgi:hypothetical protein